MNTVRRTNSDIHFGSIQYVAEVMTKMGLNGHPCVLISDNTVFELHGSNLTDILGQINCQAHVISIPPGEISKSQEQYQSIVDQLLRIPIERSTPLLALGGGVVGDLAGFVAATLFRGIPFIQIPTTLIAQVDSSIGGKTGINHKTGKNLIGSFYPAKSIVVDSNFLDTLDDRELRNGLAEVIKAGLIGDIELVEFIQSNRHKINERDVDALKFLIKRAAKVKMDVVEKDEYESGIRAHLNFGHTFAHGIENSLGYGAIGHGEAVGIGMIAALLLSSKLDDQLNFEREIELIQFLVAPRSIKDLSWQKMETAFLRDKKRIQGKSRFIVLSQLGKAKVVWDVEADLVKESFLKALELID